MTPSETAKSYGAKSLTEIAEWHKTTAHTMRQIHKRDINEFECMCWKWAKKNAPHAKFLRRAFIEGSVLLGATDAELIADINGY